MRTRSTIWFLLALFFLFTASSAFATPTAATVGRHIFFDTDLSDPPGQSCASCHDAAAGFADPAADSPVSNGAIPERVGNRNAPTAAYSSFIPPRSWDATLNTYVGGQFWDGRAESLEEQAKGPFLNPLEMNMPSKAAVVSAVASSAYAREFKAVYGPDSLSLTDVDAAYDRIASAIAAYERTADLNRFSSKHDYAMMFTGPDRMMKFTPAERMGMMLFNGTKAKCSTCHVTPMSNMTGGGMGMAGMGEIILFSDYRYANLGIPRNPANPFYALPADLNPDGAGYIDHGLAAALPGGVAANPAQDGMFKTPTLRNIAKTAPYGHNGYFPTLKSIVHFYNTRDTTEGAWPAPEVASNLETATMGALGLTSAEEDQIVAFLGSLTDGWWLTPMDFDPPVTVATITGTEGSAGWLTSEATVRLDAIDFGGGVATIDYATGTDALQTYLAPFTVTGEGVTTFRYRAKDTSGNAEPETSETVKVDRSAPVVTSANDGMTYLVGEAVPAQWNASDAVSGIATACAECVPGAMLPTDVEGERSYTITATDVAGNVTTKTVRFNVISKLTPALADLCSSATLPYGGSFVFSAKMADGRGPVGGASVALYSSTDGVEYVATGRSTVTGADGSFAFTVSPSQRTWYRVGFDGDATRWPMVSEARYCVPAIYLSAPADPASVRVKVPFTVSGRFMPGHAATIRIAKYRRTGPLWRHMGYTTATVAPEGGLTYSYRAALRLSAGEWRIRAYAPEDEGHAASWSGYTYITVK